MSETTMTPEQAAALRADFKPEQMGQKPQPYKKDSPKGNCQVCGQYHGLPAMHLDFVGHAAATDRLLKVDPTWTWEPMGLDQFGLPVLDRDNNLWIRLTVCGVTRPGVGEGKNMKERIGNAIRNAAMRFGVGLDLWAKEDLKEAEVAPDPQPDPATGEVQMTQADQLTAEKLALLALVREKLPEKTHDQHLTEIRETAAAANPPVDLTNLADIRRLITLWKD